MRVRAENSVLPRGWKEEGHGEIGLRKSMEDRHVLIQYLNELMDIKVRHCKTTPCAVGDG